MGTPAFAVSADAIAAEADANSVVAAAGSVLTVCAASDAARAHFDAGGKRGGERGTLVIGSAYGVRGV